ncbi:GNAT family N-acetyltransferase [Paenibacillus sp. 2TAF8]|jgi:RimJ/RimL family protein N-acetyltransferase|uniref:GNAT family N-acetyltransferase n=1 Tax=Paenibacillus sp. 2TAF8 TaxID=3233020 RepID=UPI003F9DB09C
MIRIKVTLRFVLPNDAGFVQQYAGDPRISETSNVPYPYPDGAGESWAKMVIARREQGISYVFTILSDNQFAGVMSLNAVDLKEKTAELDYWIAVPFWNKGIGTIAAQKAIVFAWNELDLQILRSACLESNTGSLKVLEKNGFKKVNDFVFENGKFKDKKGCRLELHR